jgi:hypothetical protein
MAPTQLSELAGVAPSAPTPTKHLRHLCGVAKFLLFVCEARARADADRLHQRLARQQKSSDAFSVARKNLSRIP